MQKCVVFRVECITVGDFITHKVHQSIWGTHYFQRGFQLNPWKLAGLKQRRQQGETNLIIKNGLRRSNATNENTSVPNLAQTSPLAQTSSSAMSIEAGQGVIRIPDTLECNQSINEPISCLTKPDSIPVYLWNSRSLVNTLKHLNSFIATCFKLHMTV